MFNMDICTLFSVVVILNACCYISADNCINSQPDSCDTPYLYGSNTMLTRGRILLVNEQLNISNVNTIVAFFEENNRNRVRIQMWYKQDLDSYTLHWQTEIAPDGQSGRTVISLPSDKQFYATPNHRLGLYSLADPCPILYEITANPRLLFSHRSYADTDGPATLEQAQFDQLMLPVRFALAVCNASDCDVLPVPTTSTSTTTTSAPTPAAQPRKHVVVTEDDDAQFLKEDIILGLIVWLIILSFVVFAIFFLLCCLFFRPSNKHDKEEGDQVGDWFLSVDTMGGGAANKGGAASRGGLDGDLSYPPPPQPFETATSSDTALP